jgi:hypothetical protein
METAKCPCGRTIEYDNPNKGSVNVKHFVETTGWYYLLKDDCSSAVVCPRCGESAVALGKRLREVLGTRHTTLSSVLFLETQHP